MSTLTNRTIRSTYGQLVQLEEKLFQDGFGTGSLSGSYELTGSQFISGTLHITGNLEVTGTASIGYLETIYETSSIIYSSGSTKFGDDTSDTHEFTGSVTISGSAYSEDWSGSFSGSFFGLIDSASNAERAVSASQADSATTASHALASSNINVTPEESSAAGHYLLFAQSNTGETQVKTDSGLTYVPQTDTVSATKFIGQLEGSASYAETASVLLGAVISASFSDTASLAISTSVVNVTSTSFAESGDGPFTGSFSSSLHSLLSGSFTGSYTGSLTGSLIGTASIADFATTASHALTIAGGLTSSQADRATSASIADELSQLATASFADTATLSRGGSGSFSGSFQGDGENLTGINSYVVANNAQERVVLATSESVSGSATAGLTYNGTTFTIAGNVNTGQGATEIYLMNQNVQVSSSVRFEGLGVGTEPSGVVGAILATNDVVAFASSDERLKENLEPIGSAVEKVGQLTGYTFDWIPMEGIHVHSGHDVGVVAQEVEKVLPEIVEDRGNGYKAVKYDKLTALLIQAVNEQQKQIEILQTQIAWIDKRL
jgi:hypothetical protein